MTFFNFPKVHITNKMTKRSITKVKKKNITKMLEAANARIKELKAEVESLKAQRVVEETPVEELTFDTCQTLEDVMSVVLLVELKTVATAGVNLLKAMKKEASTLKFEKQINDAVQKYVKENLWETVDEQEGFNIPCESDDCMCQMKQRDSCYQKRLWFDGDEIVTYCDRCIEYAHAIKDSDAVYDFTSVLAQDVIENYISRIENCIEE